MIRLPADRWADQVQTEVEVPHTHGDGLAQFVCIDDHVVEKRTIVWADGRRSRIVGICEAGCEHISTWSASRCEKAAQLRAVEVEEDEDPPRLDDEVPFHTRFFR